jgi:hypothetical protein
MPMLRRTTLIATLALVAIALTGCTGIPFSGGVSKGVPVQDETNADIQFLPSGPAVDAAPEQILRGFVEASTSPTGDWTTARQYLSTEFARTWNPSAGVVIDGGTRTIDVKSSAVYSLVTDVQAGLDALGNYQALAKPRSTTFAFTFTKASGQWRIASGPNGVILDAATFPRVFSASPLYFFAPGFVDMVPDVRWFPAHASTTTRVLKALLKGPSPWLSITGAVLSAVPRGAALVADSVPVESGVATVNFDSKSFTSGDFTAKRMLRQISSSLAGLGDVSSVDLLFSGAPQGHASVPAPALLVRPTTAPQPLVVTDAAFGLLSSGKISNIPGLSNQIPALAPRAVSLSADHTLAAVTTNTAVLSVRPDKKPVLVDSRPKLLPAVLDSDSFVWTVPSDAPKSIRISGRAGTSRSIQVPWVTATAISFLSLSPDGSRIVAGLTTASGQEVCAASIGRGDDLWPNSIGPCLAVLPPAGRLLSAAWIDASRIAVLAATSTAVLRVSTLGGMFYDLTPPIGAMTVMGSGTLMVPRLLTNYGELFEQSSSTRWSLMTSKVSVVGFTH